ncbi:MAG: pseudaminic acid synthase [Prochlorococcus sp. SP3034]|nr:pseudaminic acid synthase [Prochlorococcus sp. SP3034]
MEIDGKKIGYGYPPYIVAEMSGNHNKDINNAFALIRKAKECGADAIKLQTYTADTITINHDGPGFLVEGGLWDQRKLYDLYEEAHTPWEWHEKLFNYGKEIGITIFSSPFDETAVDFLEDLEVKAYKIASPEIIDLSLIDKVARTGKPIIISTGMANENEINEAIETVRNVGNDKIIILHCTSAYPTPINEANLSTMNEISNKFDVLTGLSDHSLGTKVSIYACLLGACLIEKHFTIDRSKGGVDSQFSLEPNELYKLVEKTRELQSIIGIPAFNPTKSESISLTGRRSIYAVRDIKKGEVFTKENIRSIRPGKGLKPKYIKKIIGMEANIDINFGEPLSFDMIKDFIDY